MHEFLADVLPFVAAFYLAESCVLVGPGECLFRSFGGGFRVFGEGLFVATLAPVSRAYSAFSPPIRCDEHGVVLAGGDPDVLPWGSLGPIEADRHRLSVAGQAITTPSAREALILLDRLVRLRDAAPESRRASYAQACAGAHDLASLGRLVQSAERHAGALRRMQAVVGFLAVALVSLVLFGRELWAAPAMIVPLMLLPPYGLILWRGFHLLRVMGEGRGHALSILAGFALFPPSALHLSGLLGRHLCAGYSPLTVAALLLPGAEFRRLARERLRRLDLTPGVFAEEERAAVQRLVETVGFSVEEVREAPFASDPTAISYCPLCSAEYRSGFALCASCGAPLERLATSVPAPDKADRSQGSSSLGGPA